jgi:hypothetical protein
MKSDTNEALQKRATFQWISNIEKSWEKTCEGEKWRGRTKG